VIEETIGVQHDAALVNSGAVGPSASERLDRNGLRSCSLR
jgi:hypothetical protein